MTKHDIRAYIFDDVPHQWQAVAMRLIDAPARALESSGFDVLGGVWYAMVGPLYRWLCASQWRRSARDLGLE